MKKPVKLKKEVYERWALYSRDGKFLEQVSTRDQARRLKEPGEQYAKVRVVVTPIQ